VKDEDERERHQINFMALAREIARLLKDFGEHRKQVTGEEGEEDYSDEFDDNLIHKYVLFHIILWCVCVD